MAHRAGCWCSWWRGRGGGIAPTQEMLDAGHVSPSPQRGPHLWGPVPAICSHQTITQDQWDRKGWGREVHPPENMPRMGGCSSGSQGTAHVCTCVYLCVCTGAWGTVQLTDWEQFSGVPGSGLEGTGRAPLHCLAGPLSSSHAQGFLWFPLMVPCCPALPQKPSPFPVCDIRYLLGMRAQVRASSDSLQICEETRGQETQEATTLGRWLCRGHPSFPIQAFPYSFRSLLPHFTLIALLTGVWEEAGTGSVLPSPTAYWAVRAPGRRASTPGPGRGPGCLEWNRHIGD